MMNVEQLHDYISRYGVNVLKENGVQELFPPQAEAVEAGLFSRENMVIAIPTASGKTLITELAMVSDVIKGGKCMYTVPLRALAMEKQHEFSKWEEIGIETGLSIGDYESKDEWLGEKDILVTTSEKADSLMRNRASWLKDLNCLVVDEIHLLDSAKRGATLEVLIAKLRKINPDIRIIALSATIPNADHLAEWLDARVITSEWRPVPLYEGVFLKGEIELYRDTALVETKEIGGKDYLALALDSLEKNTQVIIFDSTRRNAESSAEHLSKKAYKKFKDKTSNEDVARAILEENDGELSQKLAECVRVQVAFHHAGLLNSQRKVIEDAYREKRIKAVASTPTLAAGVNLPAERVIVKSYYRFVQSMNQPIKVLEYKQMAGRAGRPGLDVKGEAILKVKNNSEKERVIDRYIYGEPEKIMSKLGSLNHLRFHALSLISEGYAGSIDQLDDFFSLTFFFYQNEVSAKYELEKISLQLDEWEMLDFDGSSLSVTKFGDLVSRLYIDPLTGYVIYDTLNNKGDFNEYDTLHLLCRAPDMENLYIKKSDDWIEDLLDRFDPSLVPSEESADFDYYLREIKTALLLHEWINEVDEDRICHNYGISPGDLRRIMENAEWLSYSLTRITNFVNHSQKPFFSEMEKRIKFGVKKELVDLVDIKGVGRARARKLYNAGIKSKGDIVKNSHQLPSIIGQKTAKKILEQV